jgi:hypothetical protein
MTVAEVDLMREAVAHLVCQESGLSSFQVSQAIVEDRLRTYLSCGFDLNDLTDRIREISLENAA